jgi:hypothetical protein
MLKVAGQGELFANAYGGIMRKDLTAGEKMTVGELPRPNRGFLLLRPLYSLHRRRFPALRR